MGDKNRAMGAGLTNGAGAAWHGQRERGRWLLRRDGSCVASPSLGRLGCAHLEQHSALSTYPNPLWVPILPHCGYPILCLPCLHTRPGAMYFSHPHQHQQDPLSTAPQPHSALPFVSDSRMLSPHRGAVPSLSVSEHLVDPSGLLRLPVPFLPKTARLI